MNDTNAVPTSPVGAGTRGSNLEQALRAIGFRCTVEGVDRLAVIVADDEVAEREIAARRREALREIGVHGFTHLALEVLAEPAERATLHRD